MRDLTADEIREYLEFAHGDLKAEDFHREQHRLIGDMILEAGLVDAVCKKLMAALKQGLPPEDLFLSLWVSAFQMGRECESRLLTLALKGGHS